MGHLAYTRSPGGWIALSVLFASEMEDIDGKLFKAINGDEGGSWSPSAQIVLGGAGLKVNGPVEGTWTPATQISVGGAGISVTGPSHFSACTGMIINGAGLFLGLSNGAFIAISDAGHIQFGDTSQLHITGTSSMLIDAGTTASINPTTATSTGTNWTFTNGTWSFVNKTVSLDAATTVADASSATRTGPTVLSGNNAAVGRRYQVGADADTTYDASQFDVLRVPRLTATRVYTLSATANNIKCDFELFWYFAGNNPGSGQVLGPTQLASTGSLEIVSSTGSVDIVLTGSPSSASGDGIIFWHAKFHFDGTDWKVVAVQHP